MKELPFSKAAQIRRVPKFLDDDGIYRFPDGREICDLRSKKGRDEYANRKLQMFTRQKGMCALQMTPQCKEKRGRMSRNEMQFDHESGRGGGKQDDRIEAMKDGKLVPQNAAVCPWCNCAKGSRKVPYVSEMVP